MQQDDWETFIFVLCVRAGHYRCPSKRSCKVTSMITTSTGLNQISLLTAVPFCKGLTMRENSIIANTRKRWTAFFQRAARLLPNEWRCHESSPWILQRPVGPLLDFRVILIATEVIYPQTMLVLPCWCLNSLYVLVFGLQPTGMQLSSGWGGNAIK